MEPPPPDWAPLLHKHLGFPVRRSRLPLPSTPASAPCWLLHAAATAPKASVRAEVLKLEALLSEALCRAGDALHRGCLIEALTSGMWPVST